MDYDEFGNYIGPDQPVEVTESESEASVEEVIEEQNDQAIVLQENKVYYPPAQQVYGDVDIVDADEDAQDISVPLIKPIEEKVPISTAEPPKVRYDRHFQRELQKTGVHSRVVVLLGAQGHGKTSLIDVLVENTHFLSEMHLKKPLKYTHTQEFEKGRDLSVFITPISLLLQSSQSKSFNIHFLDTPGHSDFFDEVNCAMSLADGGLLLIDVVEGLLPAARRAISRAAELKLPLKLVFTKIDRLIIDLKLPPTEAYHRLDYLLDEVNDFMVRAHLEAFDSSDVLFTSASNQWCFNLDVFAEMYEITPMHLWGDVFFENQIFSPNGNHWSFAELVLAPIYKIYSAAMSSDDDLAKVLEELGVSLKKREFRMNYLPRLRLIFNRFLGWSSLVDKITEFPYEHKTIVGKSVVAGSQLLTLARIGELLAVGDEVQGQKIENFWIPYAQYRIPQSEVYPGEIVLIDVEPTTERVSVPAVKLGIEPLLPTDQPKMLAAVSQCLHLFPGLHAEAQDSGDYVLFGTGEMFFDCVMYYIRAVLGHVEVKVSDPAVKFAEGCVEQSYASCPVSMPGGGSITVLASPVPQELSKELAQIPKTLAALKPILKAHGWDNMGIRSVWCFGPDVNRGSCLILNDVLGENRALAEDAREEITDGFIMCAHRGPLCDEELHDTIFKVIDFDKGKATSGQIVAAARRACYSAFLVASPRLLEPWYEICVVGPLKAGRSVYENLRRRRGKVLDDRPIPGTNLYRIEGKVPVIDSFGLETDIRVATKGQTKISFVFSHYAVVPGDPLDGDVELQPLETAVGAQLARNFVSKTRKRKGLSNSPSLAKYLDKDVAEVLGVS